LFEELTKVKREGVAYDIEEYYSGVSSVGAPVFDRSGAIAASVAAIFAADRFGPDERPEIAHIVKACAASMSGRLGWVTTEPTSDSSLIALS
jgi:DNA-binding IclR family transcriptional regulator